MRKRIWITISVICIICITVCLLVITSNGNSTKTIADHKAKSEPGIYYEPIDAEISLKVNDGLYSCSVLHYNNHFYTSNYMLSFDNDIRLNNLEVKKTGTVFGNYEVKWSTNKNELYSSTCKGTLYSLQGFDSSFLKVIAYKLINNRINLQPYVRLNGITLQYGEQLYKDRFHIENCSSIYCVNSKDYEPDKRNGIKLSLNDPVIKDFLATLYHSKFIKPTDELTEKLYHDSDSDYAILTFAYANKLLIDCNVYKNGYVCFSDGNSNFVIKMDDKKCSKLFELANR